MRKLTINVNIIYASIAFFLIAIAWASVFVALTHMRSLNIIYVFVLLIFLLLLWNTSKISKEILLFIAGMMLIILFVGIFKDAEGYIKRLLFFPVTLLFTLFLSRKKQAIEYLSKMMTIYIIIALICSIISFFYAYFGYPPIFEIVNADGRINRLYLLTFSNVSYGHIIRPAFIYDEPGAFSFVICFVAILRTVLKQNSTTTFLIILGGLITLSLSHVLILLVFLATKVEKKYYLPIIAFFIVSVIFLAQQKEMSFFFNRFQVSQNGTIEGDNRSDQIKNFMKIEDEDIFLYGKYKCYDRPELCIKYGSIASSPVSPMYEGGILYLLIQLMTYFILLWVAYKKKAFRFAGISLFLLLLQRPYFGSAGYQLMIYIILFYCVQEIYENSKKRENKLLNKKVLGYE